MVEQSDGGVHWDAATCLLYLDVMMRTRQVTYTLISQKLIDTTSHRVDSTCAPSRTRSIFILAW